MDQSIVAWMGNDPASEGANIIGQNIRSVRESLGLSREELARRIGTLTATGLYYIETGRRQARPDTLESIAAGLGTTVLDLHRPEPEGPPPAEVPHGLRDMIEKGLADPPPSEEELAELRRIRWRGSPDAVSFFYALQAIRRANRTEE